MTVPQDWQRRVDQLWETIDSFPDDEFVARMATLVDELPPNDPVGLYERGGSYDSTDRSDLAVPLYQQALANGLSGPRRRQAIIQLASSLRNLDRATESVELLTAERAAGSDELDDAVAAFLALALVDVGRARAAAALVIGTLAPHLPRYRSSVANYARMLTDDSS